MSNSHSMDIHVTSLAHGSPIGRLRIENWTVPCALGRNGLTARKREGDGATPIGRWPIRQVFYRADRTPFHWRLPRANCRRIDPDLGWCDDDDDRNYNRIVRHPYPASAERLWRDDHLYDVVLALGYNDIPRVRSRGSAIFLHLAKDDSRGLMRPTAGCVALRRRDLAVVLAKLQRTSHVHVHG